MNVNEIWNEAVEAGKAAAIAHNEQLGAEQARGFDCGFAWVVIKPARGALVKHLKSLNVGRTADYGGGGYHVWYSALHDVPTQSMTVHAAAAKAATEVLVKHGIPASWSQRFD